MSSISNSHSSSNDPFKLKQCTSQQLHSIIIIIESFTPLNARCYTTRDDVLEGIVIDAVAAVSLQYSTVWYCTGTVRYCADTVAVWLLNDGQTKSQVTTRTKKCAISAQSRKTKSSSLTCVGPYYNLNGTVCLALRVLNKSKK